jgi:hypothetical protein
MQKIFTNKCFVFTVGSVCRVKRFSRGGKGFVEVEEVETEAREWLRQFRRIDKAMAQVYQY